MQQIHFGNRHNEVSLISNVQLQSRPDTIVALPSMIPLLTSVPNMISIASMKDILEGLEANAGNLEISIKQHQLHLDISKQDSEASEKQLVTLNEELNLASERYDYFQNLSAYITDLIDFIDAKVPLDINL